MIKINFYQQLPLINETVSLICFVTSSCSSPITPIYNIHTSPTNQVPALSFSKNLYASHIQDFSDFQRLLPALSVHYHAFCPSRFSRFQFLMSLHHHTLIFFHVFHKCYFAWKSKQGIKCCNCSAAIFLPMLMLIGFLSAITQLIFD